MSLAIMFSLFRSGRAAHACAAAVTLTVLGPLAACSKSVSTAVRAGGKGGDEHPVKVQHWPCDAAKASQVERRADGKVTRYTTSSGGYECEAVDLNGDGKIDRYTYRERGVVVRIESAYGRDGRVDEVQNFRDGALYRKDREMNLDGKFDTWDFYEDGKLVRRDRDTDGDGRVDQWWTFPDPSKLECPVVATDKDGDGRPDVGSELDMCKVSDDDPANLLATNAPPPGAAPSAPPAASTSAPGASAAPSGSHP